MSSTVPKFHGKLFSTPMVKALANGTKTQTRRIVAPQPTIDKESGYVYSKKAICDINDWKQRYIDIESNIQIGDYMWVRETHVYNNGTLPTDLGYVYKAELGIDNYNYGKELGVKWQPSLFMPKKACRLWLKVSHVGIEPLQDITEADAIAEGVIKNHGGYEMYDKHMSKALGRNYCTTAVESYQSLWQQLNGPESWEQNPYVWVYDFEVVKDRPEGFLN